jgi:deoxycytidylate deaminase
MNSLIRSMTFSCLQYSHKIQSKHIAVIIKNSRPITSFVFNGELHAEMNAIKNFNRKCGLYEKKISMIVLRVNLQGELKNSKPCYHCLEELKNIGIRKIYYSNEHGEIIMEKTKNMETTHISRNRRNGLWK